MKSLMLIASLVFTLWANPFAPRTQNKPAHRPPPIDSIAERIKKERAVEKEWQAKIALEERAQAQIEAVRNPKPVRLLGKSAASSVVTPDSYEPNNNFATAKVVALPCTLQLSISPSDTDVFKMKIDSGYGLNILYEATDWISVTFDLYNNKKSALDGRGLYAHQTAKFIPVEKSDSFYLEIDNSWNETGNYKLILSASPYHKVSGTVLSTGDSLPYGFYVNVFDSNKNSLTYTWLYTTTNPHSKEYSVLLPSGTYFFNAELTDTFTNIYYQQKYYLADADPVVVSNSDISGINFIAVKGGTISGRIVNNNNVGISNVYINIKTQSQSKSTHTDLSGIYSITGITPSKYTLYASPDYSSNYIPQYYSGKTTIGTADTISIGAGEVLTGYDFILATGGVIEGVVKDNLGNPIEGINVYVNGWNSSSYGYARTDINGKYSVNKLSSGKYYAQISSDSVYMSQYYNQQTDYWQKDTIDVVAGSIVSGIDFTLRRGGTIRGRVIDENGLPVKNVWASAYQDTNGNGSYGSGYSDTAGYYSITGLKTARYIVYVSANSYIDQYYDQKSTLKDADRVQVIEGSSVSNVNFSLRKGGAISGTISTVDGKPLSSYIYLYAQSVNSNYSKSFSINVEAGKTQVDFEFSGLVSGSYYMQISEMGIYARMYYPNAATTSNAVPVNVTDGATTANINLILEPSCVIQGTITASDGNMFGHGGDVEMMLYDTLGKFVTYGRADSIAPGTLAYMVSGLPKGVYKLEASYFNSESDTSSNNGYLREYYNNSRTLDQAASLTVASGDTLKSINFELDPAGAIKGYLRYKESGEPVVNTVVIALVDTIGDFLSSIKSGRTYSGTSDATGRFQIKGLPSDRYKVQAINFPFEGLTLTPFVNQFYNGALDPKSAQVLTVTEPDAIDSVNFSLEKGKGGVVTGKITNIENKDSYMIVFAFDSTGFALGLGSNFVTNDGVNENYLINGLSSGSYKIGTALFLDEGLKPQIFYHPSDTSFANAKAITVVKGDTTKDIDIKIPDYIGVEGDGIAAIAETAILSNIPNPFNPVTTINYSIAGRDAGKTLRLSVYDIKGTLVRELSQGKAVSGARKVVWDGRNQFGRNCASGVYLVKMSVGNKVLIKRVVMMK